MTGDLTFLTRFRGQPENTFFTALVLELKVVMRLDTSESLLLRDFQRFSCARGDAYSALRKDFNCFEIRLTPPVFTFLPNEIGWPSFGAFMIICSPAVQAGCIFVQSLALSAIAGCLRNPTAWLCWRTLCMTAHFAQKRDANPVGGRGIGAFAEVFSYRQLSVGFSMRTE